MAKVTFGMPNSVESFDYTRYTYNNINGTFTNKIIYIDFIVPKDAELKFDSDTYSFEDETPTITNGGESYVYRIKSSYNSSLTDITSHLKPSRKGYTFCNWSASQTTNIPQLVPPCEGNVLTYTSTWDSSAPFTFIVSPPSIIQNRDSLGKLINGSQTFLYRLSKGENSNFTPKISVTVFDKDNKISSSPSVNEDTYTFNENVSKIVFTENISGLTYTVPVFTFETGVSVTNVEYFYHADSNDETKGLVDNDTIKWNKTIESTTSEKPNLWCKCVASFGRLNQTTTTYYIVSKLTHSFAFSCDTDVISVPVDKDKKVFENCNYSIKFFFRDSYKHKITSVKVSSSEESNFYYDDNKYTLTIGNYNNSLPQGNSTGEEVSIVVGVGKNSKLPTYLTFTITSTDVSEDNTYIKKIYFNELRVEGIKEINYTNVSYPESILDDNNLEKSDIIWSSFQPTQTYTSPYAWTRITYLDGTQVHFRTTNYSLMWIGDKASHPNARNDGTSLMYMDAYYNIKEHVSYVYVGNNEWTILAKGEHPHYELFIDKDCFFIDTDNKGYVSEQKTLSITAYVEYDRTIIDVSSYLNISGDWTKSVDGNKVTFTKNINSKEQFISGTVNVTFNKDNVSLTKTIHLIPNKQGETFNWLGEVNIKPTFNNNNNSYTFNIESFNPIYMSVIYNKYDHCTYVYGLNTNQNSKEQYTWQKLIEGTKPTYSFECDTQNIIIPVDNEGKALTNTSYIITITGTYDGSAVTFGNNNNICNATIKPNDNKLSVLNNTVTLPISKGDSISDTSYNITISGYENYSKTFVIRISPCLQGRSFKWLGVHSTQPTVSDSNKYIDTYYDTITGTTKIYNNGNWETFTKNINWYNTVPNNPQVLDAYYDAKSSDINIYDGSNWQTMMSGFKYMGNFESHPSDPTINSIYYNTKECCSYIYTNDKWYSFVKSGNTFTGLKPTNEIVNKSGGVNVYTPTYTDSDNISVTNTFPVFNGVGIGKIIVKDTTKNKESGNYTTYAIMSTSIDEYTYIKNGQEQKVPQTSPIELGTFNVYKGEKGEKGDMNGIKSINYISESHTLRFTYKDENTTDVTIPYLPTPYFGVSNDNGISYLTITCDEEETTIKYKISGLNNDEVQKYESKIEIATYRNCIIVAWAENENVKSEKVSIYIPQPFSCPNSCRIDEIGSSY